MDDAAGWVTSSCADLGLEVTAPGDCVQDRPWSRVVVFEVRDAGDVTSRIWFKANGIGTRYEPELVSTLGSIIPDLVPEVIAADAGRGWSLTRDAGPTWRGAIPVADLWPLWEDLLQRYAVAQLMLAAHRGELLATGVPERSPASLPGQAGELVAELALLRADSGGLPVVRAEKLMAALPAYGQRCRELEGAGIPLTIQHDDLHSNNICREGTAKDRTTGSAVKSHPAHPSAGSRVIDWGDASIGHPFGTLLATLRSIAHHGGCDLTDPRVQRVRDAYLEPFTSHALISELRRLADVAQRVGSVTRALSWRAALSGSTAEVHREHDFPVRGWMLELLTDPPT